MSQTQPASIHRNDLGYLGNPRVKRDGVNTQFTNNEVAEYLRCMQDPVYFARNYAKVISLDKGIVPFDLWPYQEKMFKHFEDNRFSIVLAPRQSGKSISSCIYLLWYALFHPEKTIAILANKGSTAREMISRITLALENLPFFLQPGCRALNKGSIEFSNNSRLIAAATTGSSIRGLSISLLFLDEFAFVQDAGTFYTSTYPVITSGKSSRVIISSTPKGIGNMFHKLWEGAVQGTNEFKPFRVNWWDVPGRDDKWKEETIRNTSELQFAQEFSCLGKCTKITIRVNKRCYEVEIGQFYGLQSRARSGDLSFEEELGRIAVRRDDLDGEEAHPLIEILTPSGFKPFAFVRESANREGIRVVLDNGDVIDCTPDHRFVIDGVEIEARGLSMGLQLCPGKVISNILPIETPQSYYDPVGVEDGALYLHDGGIVSHNCSFLGTGSTLINADALLELKAIPPIYEQNSIKVYEKPIKGETKDDPGHQYVMTVDVGRGRAQDYSTFNIIDVTARPFKQVATFRNNTISPLLFPDVIYKYAKTYNDAYVIIESNDQGSVVCNGLYYDFEYENMYVESAIKTGAIGLETTKKVKRIGCSNLKDLIETRKLQILDADTILELSTFEAAGNSWEATEGNHDDLVMNLVLFAWYVSTDTFQANNSVNLKEMLYQDRLKAIEEDVTPVGFIPKSDEDPLAPAREVDSEGNVWTEVYRTDFL